MRYLANYLFIIGLLITTGVLAQANSVSQDDSLDQYITAKLQGWKVPGMALVVIKDGKVVKTKGYGVAQLEWKTPVRPNTVFEIASLTKSFTAVMVMLLIEEGKLKLDDKLSTHLDSLPAAWQAITIRHLLSHTAGIRNYSSLPPVPRLQGQPFSYQELLQRVGHLPLEFKPGEAFKYSNSNYYVLGELIEKTSGLRYGDFLRERITKPLGMRQTRMNDFTEVIPNRAGGYAWDSESGRLKNREIGHPSGPYAAGAILSTIHDMAIWDMALHTGKIVKPSVLAQMWTPYQLADGSNSRYGLGWYVDKTIPKLSHGGKIGGFTSNYSHYPTEDLTIVLLTNSGLFDPGALAHRVAGFFHAKYKPDQLPKPIRDDDPAFAKAVETDLNRRLNGQGDSALYTSSYWEKVIQPSLDFSKRYFSPLGPVKKVVLVKKLREAGKQVLHYLVSYEHVTFLKKITREQDGKISKSESDEL